MTESAAAPAQPAPEQGLSEGQRLVDVFIAPSKTFTDLKRKASWIGPFILLAIMSYAFMGVVSQKVSFEQATENEMRLNPRQMEQMDSLPAQDRAQRMQVAASFTKGIFYVYPVVLLVITGIIAGLMLATFNFGLGADIAYGTAFAVVMYALLPGVLRVILAAISLYAGASPEGFLMDNPVASNFGSLVDAAQHPAIYRLASATDIFAIWQIVLLGIGFSCVSKVKRNTAIGVVAGWYILVTLIRVGFAAI